MIVIDVEQGTDDWKRARMGIPTASQFHRLLTAKTHKPSAGMESYIHELAAEWLLGEPMDNQGSAFTDRGSEMESKAVAYYEFTHEVETEKVGFVLLDDYTAGCSPDRLIGKDGGLEIKCPGAPQHVANLLGMAEQYQLQVQGCMWICERAWWDLASYNPYIPPAIVRIERNDELIEKIAEAVSELTDRLETVKEKLLGMGCTPALLERETDEV